jgi:hypothetical protein
MAKEIETKNGWSYFQTNYDEINRQEKMEMKRKKILMFNILEIYYNYFPLFCYISILILDN